MDYSVAMQRAIDLSQKGLGKTAPNPIVGAVIIDSTGAIIGQGFHDRMNSPDHAEVVALKVAGNSARGATMVVTLEPCNHIGTTGSCAATIIAAGITTVVFAISDPNIKAAGGAQTLLDAGVTVIAGVSNEVAAFANRAWLLKVRKGRPFFTWKVAATLDGKVAASDGTSQWITNEEARADVQLLRRYADAILVGTNTVIADDPHLIPRGNFVGYPKNPLRVVCGQQDLPTAAKIFDTAAPTLVVKSKDLNLLLDKLKEAGVNQVLVEAGPTLATAMLQAGLLDELVIYQAPSIIGAGKSFVADLGATTINQQMLMNHISTQVIAGDIKSVYQIRDGA